MATTKKLYNAIKDEYEIASVQYAYEDELWSLTEDARHLSSRGEAYSLILALEEILRAMPIAERESILTAGRKVKPAARENARAVWRKRRATDSAA
ncbi:hypothetical protein, partial [Microbacterium sp.]|uniref:hypothetical protein n=1 Tax=Microbacterium sp. TaxID=51671 RepID=UPI00261CB431